MTFSITNQNGMGPSHITAQWLVEFYDCVYLIFPDQRGQGVIRAPTYLGCHSLYFSSGGCVESGLDHVVGFYFEGFLTWPAVFTHVPPGSGDSFDEWQLK